MIRTGSRFSTLFIFLAVVSCTVTAQTPPSFIRSDIAVGNFPVSLAVADFNGDTKPDIAVLADTDNATASTCRQIKRTTCSSPQ